MIAADALAHVVHNSTVESRRKGLNLRDIEDLSLCLCYEIFAAGALAHVVHNSTVESRRKCLNLRDIEDLSLCLWCSMALKAGSRLFGQGECWRIYFKQNLVVTDRKR